MNAKPASLAGADFDAKWRALVFPPGHRNPEPHRRYHLVVIGAGPAGLVTAIAAAGLGAKVALVEKHAMGGDCLNVGCVPSKALLEFASASDARSRQSEAFTWIKGVRAAIAEHDSVARYTAAGVDVFLGTAKYVDAHTICVNDKTLRCRRSVIATGAHAALPPVPGLREAKPLTNETVFNLNAPPQRLIILGAGPIGCELAQAFARLGSQVTLIERETRILPAAHPDASDLLAAALQRDGVELKLGASVRAVARTADHVRVEIEDAAIDADEILVAAGRVANTGGLNLAAAGVEVSERGLVAVDAKLRTTHPHIFAAGDVCSTLQFTHVADAHARIVVQNALFLPTATTRKLIVPHCTYTSPEVAQIGPLASTLAAQGTAHETHTIRFAETDRGRTQGDDVGFAEIVTAADGNSILGATIFGCDAGEQIASVCLAMTQGIGLGSLASTILPYPTRAEFLRRLADRTNRRRLTPTVRTLMRGWFKWTS